MKGNVGTHGPSQQGRCSVERRERVSSLNLLASSPSPSFASHRREKGSWSRPGDVLQRQWMNGEAAEAKGGQKEVPAFSTFLAMLAEIEHFTRSCQSIPWSFGDGLARPPKA